MLNLLKKPLRPLLEHWRLPEAARAERRRDEHGSLPEDPGINRAVREALQWLGRAQDASVSQDGGVARHYSLVDGWAASYPETTGYIIPTLLECAEEDGDRGWRERARRMLDWLVSIQLPEGGFPGGVIGQTPAVATTFNTGQVLMGLAAGAEQFGEPYRSRMQLAADWLVATQDQDGCWRRYPSPFVEPGEKVYDVHVAWGLLEAARLGSPAYAEAALRNVHWALKHQAANGWFDHCCLTNPAQPLTHTIGYALRGIVEAHLFTGERDLLEAASRTADGLLGAMRRDGFLPGRLNSRWEATVPWACLTGAVQIASCWLLLYQCTGNDRYRDAAFAANRFVRRTVAVEGRPETRGGVKGSYPVSGDYGRYQYPNWACKFFIDSNKLEKVLRTRGA